MNKNKFAFIICTNNTIYLNECITYIEQLEIPVGYSVDLLTIPDASCITAGYNEGMLSSDAKYKIYMHQDVFLFNRSFLYDILSIFQSDLRIGLIGMVGYPSIPENGCMWQCPSISGAYPFYGSVHAYPHADYSTYHYDISQDGISDVALVDGLCMITAYDLPWNTEELTGWDFYDAFQSVEFLLHGYRVVVPNQSLPWFLHDDGKFLSLWNYDKYRQIFLKIYNKYLGKSYNEIRDLL